MKLKKVLVVIVLAIAFMLNVLLYSNVVYAATASTPMYLGITELKMDSGMGYAIGDPGTGSTTSTAAKIWNIVKYSTASSNDPTEANIYCVKSGVGFQNTNERATYDIFYDMKSQKSEIQEQNEVLRGLVEGTIELDDGTTISQYSAILASLDLFYYSKTSSEEDRAALLQAAQVPTYTYNLTDDDIEAVQQAALWYFTNYGEDNGKFDQTSKSGWLNYTTNGTSYTSLGDYNIGTREGQQREEQAQILYNYLVRTAIKNAPKYDNVGTQSTGAPAQVNTTRIDYEESNGNYIIGPINISENASNPSSYTIDFVVEEAGTETSDYKLLDSNQSEVSQGTTVKDLVGQNFYISVPNTTNIGDISVNITINYSNTKLTLWVSSTNNGEQPVVIPEKENVSVPTKLTVTPHDEREFDLALRKYITEVNGVELTGANVRVPEIDESTLASGTTATYKHRKDPVLIESGDVVTYKITIYNEGEKAGRATKIIDQLPEGLTFSQIVSGNFELDSYDEETNRLSLKRSDSNTENLDPYTDGNLDSETIEIECTVTAKPDTQNSTVLTNVAWISEEYDAEDQVTITNQEGADRDSEPSTTPNVNKDNMSDYTGNGNKSDLTDSDYYYKGQQDDDDFEKLVLLPETFDLKLIKRIVAVNDQNVPERIESIDVSDLNVTDSNGNIVSTTADYQMNKEPVGVKKGDIVTYTFRIYNEGTINGYAQEITEDVPEGLEFLWSEETGDELEADETLSDAEKEAIEFNQSFLWGNFIYDESGERIIQISTDYLSKENEGTPGSNLIDAFGRNDGTKTEEDLSYKEVSVKFKVIADNIAGTVIRNEAAITEDCDEEGNPVDDRDSDTEDWVKYEDDEDYDNVVLQSFDLALRKFIIAVSDDETIEEDEYLRNDDGSYTRAPVVDTSLLNTEDENGNLITTAIYNHTKEPVLVQRNNIVIYMLRVYNEGDIDGYASEIKDHLPPYLEYVDGEFNDQYGWEVSEDGRTLTTRYLEDTIINKAELNENDEYVLSYREVPVMCRVVEGTPTSENVTNIADITEYLDDNKEETTDRDSQSDNVELPDDEDLPGYKGDETGEYIPGQQDDDDFEKVIVKEFDLALRKWVTQAIVIENGKETITETGHGPYDDPEEIVKVELYRKNINDVIVKFRYKIRVTNEGDIPGYVKEITDYVPEGLRFDPADNPGWVDEGNNVISTTLTEDILLQPGEYTEVEVVLTWINDENNMGVMTNIAEISEDDNEYDLPDKDSTPDNQEEGEDDIDDAPVMITVSTGAARTYFMLGGIVLITIAGGVFLIKKFVI